MRPDSSATGMNSDERDHLLVVLPSRQRLETDHLARRQLDERLVVGDDLAGRERLPQASFQLDSSGDALQHRRVVHRHRVAAGVLGAIHRGVGFLDQRRRFLDIGPERDGDPDRHRDEHLTGVEQERRARAPA